jgi:hypothetical protein
MVAVRILALALLIHEVLKFCMEGRAYFVGTFCPTFGLRLTPAAAAASHVALAAVCSALLAHPGWYALYPTLLVALTVVVASYPLRLSNHLVVAWFLCAIICLDAVFAGSGGRGETLSPFARQAALAVLVLTYALAAFHKVNRGYLSPGTSCAGRYCELYLQDRRLQHPILRRIGVPLSMTAVLGAEVAVLLLLLTPHTFAFAFALAVVLHFFFGLLCFQHFSTVMFAAWLIAAAPPASPEVPLPLIALGAFAGGLLGAVSGYGHRQLARAVHVLFGGLAVFVFCEALRSFSHGGPSLDRAEPPQAIALLVVALLYFLNGAGPYLGVKTEFSLAMFSNLRHEPWDHLAFRGGWRPFRLARYVTVERLEGLPEPDDCPPHARAAAWWLREPERWRFSAYFLDECLRAFPSLRVVCGEHRDPSAGAPSPALRMNLHPFVLPRDQSVPHCK